MTSPKLQECTYTYKEDQPTALERVCAYYVRAFICTKDQPHTCSEYVEKSGPIPNIFGRDSAPRNKFGQSYGINFGGINSDANFRTISPDLFRILRAPYYIHTYTNSIRTQKEIYTRHQLLPAWSMVGSTARQMHKQTFLHFFFFSEHTWL